jgi:TatD DNase family protein
MGYLLGIGGAVTYPKNEYLRDVVKNVPLSSIILETDAPFLPPQIIRGKKNSPAQIQTIAKYLAELLTVPYEHVTAITSAAAQSLFDLNKK